MLCLMLTGCTGMFSENNLSLYGNPQGDGMFGIRAGTEVAENLEVGASANYMEGKNVTTTTWRLRRRPCRLVRTVEKEKVDEWQYGCHLIYRFPMDGWTPYVGGQVNIGENGDDVIDTLEPIGGLNLNVSDSMSLFSEYQRSSLHGEDDKVVAGIRLKF